jgi:hypothetical protein
VNWGRTGKPNGPREYCSRGPHPFVPTRLYGRVLIDGRAAAPLQLLNLHPAGMEQPANRLLFTLRASGHVTGPAGHPGVIRVRSAPRQAVSGE